jgi:hemerythrin
MELNFNIEPEMLSGIELIDNQHLEVIKEVNKFLKVYETCSEECKEKFINILFSKLLFHFETEYKLLKVTKYDKKSFKKHHKEHTTILVMLNKLDKSSPLAVALFTVGKVISHIEKYDQLYFEHFKQFSKKELEEIIVNLK